jgi:hypothetical protein
MRSRAITLDTSSENNDGALANPERASEASGMIGISAPVQVS